HGLYRSRRDTGSREAALRKRNRRIRDPLSHSVLRQGRYVDDTIALLCRRGARNVHLLCARITRRLPGRLGWDSKAATRRPAPAVQLRRDHAPARGTPERLGSFRNSERLALAGRGHDVTTKNSTAPCPLF